MWEHFFIASARESSAKYGAISGHYTAKESGLAAHYSYLGWLVLNRHYFGRGHGWAGTYPAWQLGEFRSAGQGNYEVK